MVRFTDKSLFIGWVGPGFQTLHALFYPQGQNRAEEECLCATQCKFVKQGKQSKKFASNKGSSSRFARHGVAFLFNLCVFRAQHSPSSRDVMFGGTVVSEQCWASALLLSPFSYQSRMWHLSHPPKFSASIPVQVWVGRPLLRSFLIIPSIFLLFSVICIYIFLVKVR